MQSPRPSPPALSQRESAGGVPGRGEAQHRGEGASVEESLEAFGVHESRGYVFQTVRIGVVCKISVRGLGMAACRTVLVCSPHDPPPRPPGPPRFPHLGAHPRRRRALRRAPVPAGPPARGRGIGDRVREVPSQLVVLPHEDRHAAPRPAHRPPGPRDRRLPRRGGARADLLHDRILRDRRGAAPRVGGAEPRRVGGELLLGPAREALGPAPRLLLAVPLPERRLPAADPGPGRGDRGDLPGGRVLLRHLLHHRVPLRGLPVRHGDARPRPVPRRGRPGMDERIKWQSLWPT